MRAFGLAMQIERQETIDSRYYLVGAAVEFLFGRGFQESFSRDFLACHKKTEFLVPWWWSNDGVKSCIFGLFRCKIRTAQFILYMYVHTYIHIYIHFGVARFGMYDNVCYLSV
jgi:hypothetical protein